MKTRVQLRIDPGSTYLWMAANREFAKLETLLKAASI
jgi:hypothetical protein